MESLSQKTQQAPQKIDAAPYITALFTANGQLRLAAERCGVSAEEMIFTIASDPNAQSLFESHLKVYALLKAFEMFGEATLVLSQKVQDLEPAQASKHFIGILTSIDSMTKRAPQQNTINLFEAAMKQLPPEVQDALKVLSASEVQTDEQITAKILNYDSFSRTSKEDDC